MIRAIDNHNSQYLIDGNEWHLEKARELREYVCQLKNWIIKEEVYKS